MVEAIRPSSLKWLIVTPAAYLQARERVTREVFLRSPAKGTAVMADAYYTEASGGSMVCRFSRSDTVNPRITGTRTTAAALGPADTQKHRREASGGYAAGAPGLVSSSQRLAASSNSGSKGSCQPIIRWRGCGSWNIFYRLDGAVQQVIREGSEFNARHPLPGVYTGRTW